MNKSPSLLMVCSTACTIVLLGCDDRQAIPTSPPAASEAVVAPSADATILRTVTRAVALALQDQGLRSRLLNDMRDSRVREHKLEFRRYLHGASGGILLAKMAARSGVSRGELLSDLDALRPLEFYFPVREQRQSWHGGADLLVAAQLKESDTPIGFDLEGRPVTLTLAAAPGTPTVVLTPVETDFDAPTSPVVATPGTLASDAGDPGCDPNADVCDMPPSGGGSPGPYPIGLFFNEMVVRDNHEPWTRGDPELEVWLSGTQVGLWEELSIPCFEHGYPPDPTKPNYPNEPNCFFGSQYYYYHYNPNATRLFPLDCAGENASGYHRFNYDGTGSFWGLYDTFFAEPDKFTILYVAKDKYGVIRDKRYVQLQPPFTVEVLERDDGYSCPEPPHRVTFKVEINFFAASKKDWVKVSGNVLDLILFRNDNDLVSRWTIPTWDALEAFNRNWLYGSTAEQGDADINVGNNGFSRTQIPPEQIPDTT